MNEHDYNCDSEITEEVVEDALFGILTGAWDTENSALEGSQIKTFEQDGVMTYNKGLVITLHDGTRYQLTIVRCR